MSSKRAAIGSFTVMWVSTVAVIIILTIFVLGSGIIKKISEEEKGLVVHGEDEVGLKDFSSYMDNYTKFREVKFSIGNGEGLAVALEGSGYEK